MIASLVRRATALGWSLMSLMILIKGEAAKIFARIAALQDFDRLFRGAPRTDAPRAVAKPATRAHLGLARQEA